MVTIRFISNYWLLLLVVLLPGCLAQTSTEHEKQINPKQMYERGLQYGSSDDTGKPISPSQSLYWMKKSAQEEYLPALHALGWIYYEGRGTDKDQLTAEKYFRQAATNGYAESQYMLGILYIQGGAIKKNSVTSLQWIKRAADQGHPEARRLLEHLFKQPAPKKQ